MAGVPERIKNLLIAEDEAVNSIGGGLPTETVSGTVGRALVAGKPWAKPVVALVDAVFGKGHCLRQAEIEAKRRTAD